MKHLRNTLSIFREILYILYLDLKYPAKHFRQNFTILVDFALKRDRRRGNHAS